MARVRYRWAKIRGAYYSLARMSGMLDLSRDENAKHFFPRWLSDAPLALAGGVAVAARPALRNAKRFCGAFRE